MTTKEWLKRGRKIDGEIKALLKAKQSAYNVCISTTTTLRGDIVTSDKDPHAKYDRLASLDLMIDKKVDELIDIKSEILKAIWSVQDTTYRTLLTKYYVNIETWEQIAVDMHYSYKHVVMELHPKALKEVEKHVKLVIECNIA